MPQLPSSVPTFSGRCLVTDLADDCLQRTVARVMQYDESLPPPALSSESKTNVARIAAPGDVEVRRVWSASLGHTALDALEEDLQSLGTEAWSLTRAPLFRRKFGVQKVSTPRRDRRSKGERRHRSASSPELLDRSVGEAAHYWHQLDGYEAMNVAGYSRQLQNLPCGTIELFVFVEPHATADKRCFAIPLQGHLQLLGLEHLDFQTPVDEHSVIQRVADLARRLHRARSTQQQWSEAHLRWKGRGVDRRPLFVFERAAQEGGVEPFRLQDRSALRRSGGSGV
jgi:hypothetical protein